MLATLLPLVASTVTLTHTECHTKYSTKKGSIIRTTHYSTSTVHKTCTQTTTPVSTYTPPASTVYKTATATVTATVTATAQTDTATITNTATETDTETETVTQTETQTQPTQTVTVTATTTIPTPAGFTPIQGPQKRRRHELTAESVERALPIDVSSDEELLERSALLSRGSSLRAPPALKCKGPTKYPRKVTCDVDVTKKIKTIKYVAAKKTKTITACPKTITGTKTVTATQTSTSIPADVTATVTESATVTVTETQTATATVTETEIPPTVTEQASVNFYQQCGQDNVLQLQEESAYLGNANIQTDYSSSSAFDCCQLCASQSTCNVGVYYADSATCRLLSQNSGACSADAAFYSNNPVQDDMRLEVFFNGCGQFSLYA